MIKKVSRNENRVRRHARIRKVVNGVRKLNGTAECPRLSVFRSNSHIHAQIIDDVKGVTLVACSSVSLKLANGSNVEAAKTVGAEIAKLAVAKGIENVVFDRSGYLYHGRIQALADAARENGLVF